MAQTVVNVGKASDGTFELLQVRLDEDGVPSFELDVFFAEHQMIDENGFFVLSEEDVEVYSLESDSVLRFPQKDGTFFFSEDVQLDGSSVINLRHLPKRVRIFSSSPILGETEEGELEIKLSGGEDMSEYTKLSGNELILTAKLYGKASIRYESVKAYAFYFLPSESGRFPLIVKGKTSGETRVFWVDVKDKNELSSWRER